MDGFDDLLAPSRRVLEENPFANPISSDRSHSPDPWASPFANTQQNDVFGSSALDPYANPYESLTSSSTARLDDEHEEGGRATTATTSPTSTKVEEAPLSDPLDSAAHANDDDDEPPAHRLPGFRESRDIPRPSFNETATIRPTESERFDGSSVASSTSARPLTPPAAATATPPAAHEEHVERDQGREREERPRGASGFLAHAATTPTTNTESETVTKSSQFASPLDGGLGGETGIDRSLAGLTLGGEAFGSGVGVSSSNGWGGDNGWGASSEPTPSTSSGPSFADASSSRQPEENEDSDDDKPISQTLSRIQSEDPDRAVCLWS